MEKKKEVVFETLQLDLGSCHPSEIEGKQSACTVPSNKVTCFKNQVCEVTW